MSTYEKIGFRPDIEGLRALAVSIVVLYHAGYSVLSGGFIGVDVFFVVSGFLITNIIYSDIVSNEFSLRSFYLRRIKRIVPLLLFVVFCTSVACSVVLLPNEFVAFLKSALASLLSVSNYFFLDAANGYFAAASDELPLLHTWSLSVEEQFYIVFPLLLLFCAGRFSFRVSSALFLLLLTSSFVFSVWASDNSSAEAYYVLQSRAFELLAGAGLALVWHKLPVLHKASSEALYFFGLSGILIAAFVLDKNTPFPGYAALIPCLATICIIYAGKCVPSNGYGVASLLTNKLSTSLGKISYSMYLWHWPIVALLNYKGIPLGGVISLLIVLASLALSIFSFTFIEKPFRTLRGWSFSKVFLRVYAMPSTILGLVMVLFIVNDGFRPWVDHDLQFEYSSANSPGRIYRDCFNSFDFEANGKCLLGDAGEPIAGLFIGDSMAGHYFAFMDVLAKDAGVRVFPSALSGIPPFELSENSKFKRRTPVAIEYNNERIKRSKDYKVVFIAAGWMLGYPYLSDSRDDLFNFIKGYLDDGIKVVVLASPNHVTRGLVNEVRLSRINGENVSGLMAKRRSTNRHLQKLIDQFPEIIVIDPNDVICPSEMECMATLDGRSMYLDTTHISNITSARLGHMYLEQVGNPLSAL